jgi:hypothetical protein
LLAFALLVQILQLAQVIAMVRAIEVIRMDNTVLEEAIVPCSQRSEGIREVF